MIGWLPFPAALAFLLVASIACTPRPPIPPAPPEPVPAERRDLQLATQEEQARLDLAQAKAAEQNATQAAAAATTPAARQKADDDRAAAQALVVRHTLVAAELARLRSQAQAEAIRQRDELDQRAAAAALAAALQNSAHQAAEDRRWALLLGAIATAAAVGIALLLAWAGVPLTVALRLPSVVAATAAVAAGILQAGPYLMMGLAILVLLGAAWGIWHLTRAVRASVAHGDDALTTPAESTDAIDALHTRSRQRAASLGVLPIIQNALRHVRHSSP